MKGSAFMADSRCNSMKHAKGFSLIEMIIALLILTLGLLAAGPMLSTTAHLTTLARSKNTAALTAQSALEHLADLYRRNPSAVELTPGNHQEASLREVINPLNMSVLNRYKVTWFVDDIPDPRAGMILPGRMVSVRVTPLRSESEADIDSIRNKVLSVTAIFGMEP